MENFILSTEGVGVGAWGSCKIDLNKGLKYLYESAKSHIIIVETRNND